MWCPMAGSSLLASEISRAYWQYSLLRCGDGARGIGICEVGGEKMGIGVGGKGEECV